MIPSAIYFISIFYSLETARLVLSHIRRYIGDSSDFTESGFLVHVIPAIAILCEAFPILIEESVSLLLGKFLKYLSGLIRMETYNTWELICLLHTLFRSISSRYVLWRF